jgi:hypothetical protein
MDMHVNQELGSLRQPGVCALRSQLLRLSNLPHHDRLETIEALFEEAGGSNPGATKHLFGSHCGPAQVVISDATVTRQCAEMAHIVGFHKGYGRKSAVAAIRCSLERVIVELRQIVYPGVTNMLPVMA